MNRRIALVGVLLFLLAAALIISPIPVYGSLRVTLAFEVGALLLPISLTIAFVGVTSPDPEVTTIGGVFGNPDENALRRLAARRDFDPKVRYASSPKEPVNCRKCYTLISWDAAECPRCGERRECRACGRALFFLTGAVRCLPCVRDEVFCNCPRRPRAATPTTGPRARTYR